MHPQIQVDGLFVRPGDKAALESYWVVVDARGRILGVRIEEKEARELAHLLSSGVVSPAVKTLRRNQDPFSRLIREALDEV